jgi:hypothetical protein
MTTTAPPSRRLESGSARPVLIVLLAVVMFAAGSASTWWWMTRKAAPTSVAAAPTPAPNFGPLTPSTTLAASPAAAANSAPPPSPPAEPSPAASPRVASTATGSTAPAPRARKPPAKPPVVAAPAAVPVEPKSDKLAAGKTRTASAPTFVLGTTVVESLRAVGRDLPGFDSAGVGVKRAPKVEGQIDLVMEPARLKAGDGYVVKIFLKNDGKKGIEVDEMKVSMIVDGKWSTRPLPPRARQVPPQQRVMLEELPGIWRAGVSEWVVEAVVTSKGQDVYRNRLTWK